MCINSRFIAFIKKESVLCISFFFAVISSVFVKPSAEYINYIDFRVLGLLLSLMLVVSGMKNAGLFNVITAGLLKRVNDTRSLAYVLVGLCFFSSMLITNDVALITFVPLTVIILEKTGKQKWMILIIILQTVSANLGSMLTPIGNPQNLYIYSLSGMTFLHFLKVMAVPEIISFILLILSVLMIKSEHIEIVEKSATEKYHISKSLLWIVLMIICLFAVVRIIPYYIAVIIVVVTVFIADRRMLLKADYSLLLIFVFLFIFIGNLKNVQYINNLMSGFVNRKEIVSGILLSQIISNVPAAMLLSKFTDHYSSLIIGVNLGGLGTLVASMASLISYKQYLSLKNSDSSRYLILFSLVNICFLVIIVLVFKIYSCIF